MVVRRRGPGFAFLLLLLSLSATFPDCAVPSSLTAGTTVRHHDLFAEIDPESHLLVAIDRLSLEIPEAQQPIRFSLAPTLQLDRLTLAGGDQPADDTGREIPFEVGHDEAGNQSQHITIPASFVMSGTVTFTAYYHGLINDPPREPRHLRFVTPSETAGHIGSEGVYLSSESQWYLDLPGSLSTHRLRVALPSGWTAVTQGKPRSTGPCAATLCSQANRMVTEWDLNRPSEALTLAANRFVSKTRDWTSKGGQPIQLATYLFPDEAQLADEYLDATARYLDAYIPLLGPYPFDTFAVVENFFASGLGMPSFTLLGSGIIKRHYVQPYALGHEIVHSWVGNSVFNRIDRGNWVEGLTTYLANYYWHELTGNTQQARDQRRLMLRGYNLHVPPARDYPIAQFTQKRDERDNAIGYQKAAMVFHLLRQEMGEDRFWLALKRLVEQYRGRHAEWTDLERVFAEAAERDLRWFFAQWIERDGAPALSVDRVSAESLAGDGTARFRVTAELVQTGTPFRVSVPVRIRMDDGGEQVIQAPLSQARETVTVALPSRPRWLELDPETMVLRRLARQSMPPVLNHYVTDGRRSVILAFADSPERAHPFRDVVKRIEAQDSGKPAGERAVMVPLVPDTLLPREGSVLVLAGPESRTAVQALINRHCGELVQLRDEGLTLAGKAYEGAGLAALASCHRRDQPGSVVTLVYAATPQAATTVARLLFFYGWNSYVIFKDGTSVTRGEWETTNEQMEVSFDGRTFAP